MPQPGINPPEPHVVRDGHLGLDLRRAALQREQLALLPAYARHLAVGGDHSRHRRHFDRSRGGHALSLRHLGVDEDAEAVVEEFLLEPLLTRQHQQASRDVRRPAACHVPPKVRLCLRVGEQLGAARGEQVEQVHVEGRGAVRSVRPGGHYPQRGHYPPAAVPLVPLADVLPRPIGPARLALQGDVARLADRHLEHEAAAVVRDAPHDVQPAGGAGHHQVLAPLEEARRRPPLRQPVRLYPALLQRHQLRNTKQ
eukprot:597242-Prorocentrum_minimum.AAC.3